jgi:hypothetical protein
MSERINIVANALKARNADAPDLAAVKRNCRAQAQKIISAIDALTGATEGFLSNLPADFKRYYDSVVNFRIEVERLAAACR